MTTGFSKSTVDGAVFAHKSGMEGDAQDDLSVDGGLDKAVYFYPREHYAAWEELLGSGPLPSGSFGENVTLEGWLETDLNIGDVIQIDTTTQATFSSSGVRDARPECRRLRAGNEAPGGRPAGPLSKSESTKLRELRSTRRTSRIILSRVNAQLTVEGGSFSFMAAAVSVPSCPMAAKTRMSFR